MSSFTMMTLEHGVAVLPLVSFSQTKVTQGVCPDDHSTFIKRCLGTLQHGMIEVATLTARYHQVLLVIACFNCWCLNCWFGV